MGRKKKQSKKISYNLVGGMREFSAKLLISLTKTKERYVGKLLNDFGDLLNKKTKSYKFYSSVVLRKFESADLVKLSKDGRYLLCDITEKGKKVARHLNKINELLK